MLMNYKRFLRKWLYNISTREVYQIANLSSLFSPCNYNKINKLYTVNKHRQVRNACESKGLDVC